MRTLISVSGQEFAEPDDGFRGALNPSYQMIGMISDPGPERSSNPIFGRAQKNLMAPAGAGRSIAGGLTPAPIVIKHNYSEREQ